MTRRNLLGAAPAAAALAATGCAASSASSGSTVSTYIAAIAHGLSGIMGDIAAIPGLSIPAGTMSQIQTALSTIETDAGQLGGIVTTAQAGTVQSIVSAIQQLASLLQPVLSVVTAGNPTASFVLMVVQAALSMAPTLLAAVGLQASPHLAKEPLMDSATATGILQVAAKKYGH